MNSRRALAGLLAIAPLGVLLVVVTQLPPPDRVPAPWGADGPDGLASGAGFLSALLTAAVLCALVAAAVAILQRVVPQTWSRWVIALAAAVGWGALATYVMTVWRAGVDGPDAVGVGWGLLALLIGVVGGAVAHAVHARVRPTQDQLAALVPERSRVQAVRGRGVRPVERWATDVSSGTMRVVGILLLLAFLGTAVLLLVRRESPWLVAVTLLTGPLVGLLALAWSAVRYEVDAEGLTIRSRVLPGARLRRVEAAEVAGVAVSDLDAMAWGGIGLRVLPDRTAYMVDRGGPGMVVYQRDGRRLALQVTEGDTVAREGARSLLRAAGQRLGESSGS